jgi:hypothetical protein
VSISIQLGGCALVTNGALTRYATGRYSHLINDLDLLTALTPALPGHLVTTRAPGCSNATTSQPLLNGISAASLEVPAAPFGIASSPDGGWSFAGLATGNVAVLADAGLAPTAVRLIPVSQSLAGVTLTANAGYLLAAGGSGAYVISTQRAERGPPHPVLGSLSVPDELAVGPIEVIASPDGRYAFVSIEFSDEVLSPVDHVGWR